MKKAIYKPIPDKLVILTFDDGCKSQATFVAPILKKCGFGATFYITEGLGFLNNKEAYMTWEEVSGLHETGFENWESYAPSPQCYATIRSRVKRRPTVY